jgi:hypothetical protein
MISPLPLTPSSISVAGGRVGATTVGTGAGVAWAAGAGGCSAVAAAPQATRMVATTPINRLDINALYFTSLLLKGIDVVVFLVICVFVIRDA